MAVALRGVSAACAKRLFSAKRGYCSRCAVFMSGNLKFEQDKRRGMRLFEEEEQ